MKYIRFSLHNFNNENTKTDIKNTYKIRQVKNSISNHCICIDAQ